MLTPFKVSKAISKLLTHSNTYHITRGAILVVIIHKYSEISVGVISPHLNMDRQFVSSHDQRNIIFRKVMIIDLGCTHHYFLGSMHEK